MVQQEFIKSGPTGQIAMLIKGCQLPWLVELQKGDIIVNVWIGHRLPPSSTQKEDVLTCLIKCIDDSIPVAAATTQLMRLSFRYEHGEFWTSEGSPYTQKSLWE
jgi:hypothetical protein